MALRERSSNKNGGNLKKLGRRYNDLPPNTVLRPLTNPGTGPSSTDPSNTDPSNKDLFGDNPLAARDQLLSDTLQSARKDLEKLLGPNPSQWTWGKLPTVLLPHLLDPPPRPKDPPHPRPLPPPRHQPPADAHGAA